MEFGLTGSQALHKSDEPPLTNPNHHADISALLPQPNVVFQFAAGSQGSLAPNVPRLRATTMEICQISYN